MGYAIGHRVDAVIDMGKPMNVIGGLEFANLTYTVIKRKVGTG